MMDEPSAVHANDYLDRELLERIAALEAENKTLRIILSKTLDFTHLVQAGYTTDEANKIMMELGL